MVCSLKNSSRVNIGCTVPSLEVHGSAKAGWARPRTGPIRLHSSVFSPPGSSIICRRGSFLAGIGDYRRGCLRGIKTLAALRQARRLESAIDDHWTLGTHGSQRAGARIDEPRTLLPSLQASHHKGSNDVFCTLHNARLFATAIRTPCERGHHNLIRVNRGCEFIYGRAKRFHAKTQSTQMSQREAGNFPFLAMLPLMGASGSRLGRSPGPGSPWEAGRRAQELRGSVRAAGPRPRPGGRNPPRRRGAGPCVP